MPFFSILFFFFFAEMAFIFIFCRNGFPNNSFLLFQIEVSSNNNESEIKCYDFQERLLDGFQYWAEGIALSVIGIVGILGNLISLHILRKDSMRKTSFDEFLRQCFLTWFDLMPFWVDFEFKKGSFCILDYIFDKCKGVC